MTINREGHLQSNDPLVLPSVGERQFRPDVTTGIPNLFLAGDYLVGDWEVANMEAASYNGRRAANAVLSTAGSSAHPASAIAPFQPAEWKPLQDIDRILYTSGQPNLFDTERSIDEVMALFRQPLPTLTSTLNTLPAVLSG